jgi:hypothetical protein
MTDEVKWIKLSTRTFEDDKVRVIDELPSGGEIVLL